MLCIFVCFIYNRGTVPFQPIQLKIVPDCTKSSVVTSLKNALWSGAGKRTVFATCIRVLFVLTLTPAADHNCSVFWTRCGKRAWNVAFPHCILVWMGLKGKVGMPLGSPPLSNLNILLCCCLPKPVVPSLYCSNWYDGTCHLCHVTVLTVIQRGSVTSSIQVDCYSV